MELTEKQLDSVEAVKGVRNPAYWDGRCQQHFEQQSNVIDIKDPSKKNPTAPSS